MACTLVISVIGAMIVLKILPPRNEPLPAEKLDKVEAIQQLSPAFVKEQVQ